MLVWIDLEMTGLDPQSDAILEIAAVVTDDDLEVKGQGLDLIIGCTEGQLEDMPEVVKEMHTKNGLLEAALASQLSVSDAEAKCLAFVQQFVSEPQSAPLCGNSIHVDRRFLMKHMPRLDGFLHYRCIDVSTIKGLASRWAPAIFEATPSAPDSHRALGDIFNSIDQLRYFRPYLFNPVDKDNP
jgi:oligoribonuclease